MLPLITYKMYAYLYFSTNHMLNHISQLRLVSINHGKMGNLFHGYYFEKVDLLTNSVIFFIFSSYTLFLNYVSLYLFSAALQR